MGPPRQLKSWGPSEVGGCGDWQSRTVLSQGPGGSIASVVNVRSDHVLHRAACESLGQTECSRESRRLVTTGAPRALLSTAGWGAHAHPLVAPTLRKTRNTELEAFLLGIAPIDGQVRLQTTGLHPVD